MEKEEYLTVDQGRGVSRHTLGFPQHRIIFWPCLCGRRYQNVWMYVIHRLEDSVNDCNAGGGWVVLLETGA